MALHGGRAMVTGRRSGASLYDYNLATYDAGDTFDQRLAKGFVELWGHAEPDRRAARRAAWTSGQRLDEPSEPARRRLGCGAAGSPAARPTRWRGCR